MVYSSDEEDDLPLRPLTFGYSPPQIDHCDSDDYLPTGNPIIRNRRTRRNPCIETEIGVDGDASAVEDDDDGADSAGFIVDDAVYYTVNVSSHCTCIAWFDHYI